VPTYVYLLLQTYASEGGDTAALQKKLADKGINLNDLSYFIKQ
jgi:hypothetical protein